MKAIDRADQRILYNLGQYLKLHKTQMICSSVAVVTLMFFHLNANADTLNSIVKAGVLKIGADVGFKPYIFRNKKGQVVGFEVDLAQLAAKEMGVKLEIVNTEWDGIIPALLTNKFHVLMCGMTMTPKRNLKVNFSKPYLVIGQSVLIRKNLKGKFYSYKDLNFSKFTLASKLGTTAEMTVKRLLPKAKYRAYQTTSEALQDLLNGRVDAFVLDKPFNTIFAAGKGRGKVVHLEKRLTDEPLAWAIRRNDPNIINWLNNFIYIIKRDGRYDKIYHKWFVSNDWLLK